MAAYDGGVHCKSSVASIDGRSLEFGAGLAASTARLSRLPLTNHRHVHGPSIAMDAAARGAGEGNGRL